MTGTGAMYGVIGIILTITLLVCFFSLTDGTSMYRAIDGVQYLIDLPTNIIEAMHGGYFTGRIFYVVRAIANRDWSKVTDIVMIIPDAISAFYDYEIWRLDLTGKLVGWNYLYEIEVDNTPYTEDTPITPLVASIVPPEGDGEEGGAGSSTGDDRPPLVLPPSVVLPLMILG